MKISREAVEVILVERTGRDEIRPARMTFHPALSAIANGTPGWTGRPSRPRHPEQLITRPP